MINIFLNKNHNLNLDELISRGITLPQELIEAEKLYKTRIVNDAKKAIDTKEKINEIIYNINGKIISRENVLFLSSVPKEIILEIVLAREPFDENTKIFLKQCSREEYYVHSDILEAYKQIKISIDYVFEELVRLTPLNAVRLDWWQLRKIQHSNPSTL